jgi:hypothetical protein
VVTLHFEKNKERKKGEEKRGGAKKNFDIVQKLNSNQNTRNKIA